MECRPSLGPEATVVALRRDALAPDAVVPPPADRLAAFAAVPAPRRAQGRRFALPAILALAVSALLANQLSLLASAQWGARQRPALLQTLGFRDGRTPHQSTLHRLCRAVDPAALSAAVSGYFATALPVPAPRGAQGVAIEGKAQRGRRAFATTTGGTVHARSAYRHDGGIVLAQQEIRSTAAKVEAELTVAPALIARLDWHGRVMTGDALFCQRHRCTQLRAAGGDYLLLVKEHQPTLYHDLALLFDPPAAGPSPLPLLDRREAVTLEQGHGRTHDRRHRLAATDRTRYLDWPGLAQVFRLERTWRVRGQDKRAVRYGITSLPPAAAAARLLARKRGHWGIENGLHYRKDMVFGEDRCQVRLGAGPMILATLRDTALSLLHTTGCRNVAARLRHYGQHPGAAVALFHRPRTQNA